MSLYALLMLLSFAGPFVLSFDKKVAFYKWWPALFAGIFVNGVLFISWDTWFTHCHIWSFNSDYVFGINWFNLPIEEWSFFVVVPYASVFIYACCKTYLSANWFKPKTTFFNYAFIFICLLAIVFYYSKTYTLVNCSLALVLLLIHQFWIKASYMPFFWMAYFIHLLPFFIVNGILTGAVTTHPVVLYNPQEISGFRILTIPAEDSIYALTCLLLPITIIEIWLKRAKIN